MFVKLLNVDSRHTCVSDQTFGRLVGNCGLTVDWGANQCEGLGGSGGSIWWTFCGAVMNGGPCSCTDMLPIAVIL